MLKTNREQLPVVKVQGQVDHSKYRFSGLTTPEGRVTWLQSTGGITLNARIGDTCMGWAADHLEPGATTKNTDDELYNNAYVTFSCIGNEARVVSGDAKGAKGFVTGKHGGCYHVLVHFAGDVLENLQIGDKISVNAVGQGFRLLEYPDIVLNNMSPALLDKINLSEEGGGRLSVGVSKIIPAKIMGSGLGCANSVSGDYDITLHDETLRAQYGLDDLRFGDLIAITDADSRFGYNFRAGAVSIGVIVHGDSVVSGHGPGVTPLMGSKESVIIPVLDRQANLVHFFV